MPPNAGTVSHATSYSQNQIPGYKILTSGTTAAQPGKADVALEINAHL